MNPGDRPPANVQHPRLDGAGEAIEYAVHMQAFAQTALWSRRLAGGKLAAGKSTPAPTWRNCARR